jgi:hypothetical protein
VIALDNDKDLSKEEVEELPDDLKDIYDMDDDFKKAQNLADDDDDDRPGLLDLFVDY